MEFERLEGETDNELIYRICSNKENTDCTWNDIADGLNKLLGKECGADRYRKQYQNFKLLFEANEKKLTTVDGASEELVQQKRELQKERYKLQTEKLEYNRWLRENARDELMIEKIVQAVKDLEPLEIPETIPHNEQEQAYLLPIADCHYGIEFEIKDLAGNVLNAYSPEIFKERMQLLLSETINYVKKNHIKNINVWEMGDGIQGMLRLNSQLLKLRFGVIDSAVNYGYYLSSWLNALSMHTHVDFQMVMDSNHNQLRMLGQPKNAFPEENVSKIILTIIKARLEVNPNVRIIENPTGFNYGSLAGYSVLGIHGEVPNLAKAISEFSTSYKEKIDYMIGAHVHHSETKEVGMDNEAISVRSVIGVDPYGLSINKVSNAGCSIFTFERGQGLVNERRIKLS